MKNIPKKQPADKGSYAELANEILHGKPDKGIPRYDAMSMIAQWNVKEATREVLEKALTFLDVCDEPNHRDAEFIRAKTALLRATRSYRILARSLGAKL